MLQEHQEGKIKASHSEKKVIVEENFPCEAETREDLSLPETHT